MYIPANMANLRKCSRCKSEIDISFFGLNRKKQPCKTCDNCRSKPTKRHAPLKRTDTDFVDGVVSADIDINWAHVKKTYEGVSTSVSESDVIDEQYKHRCSNDATDISTLVGQDKHQTDVYKRVMKYWEQGFQDDYLTMHSNRFDHEIE